MSKAQSITCCIKHHDRNVYFLQYCFMLIQFGINPFFYTCSHFNKRSKWSGTVTGIIMYPVRFLTPSNVSELDMCDVI